MGYSAKSFPEFLLKNTGMEKLCSEHGVWNESQKKYDCNMSAIENDLIQNTGRFVEMFAGDLLIWYDCVTEALKRNIEGEDRKIVLFALYKNGVDSNDAVELNTTGITNRNPCSTEHYRRIFAVVIEDDSKQKDGSEILVSLYDVTNYNALALARFGEENRR